jgi:hypothetical protein
MAPVWFLIQALYTGGNRLDGILPFCGDEAERVTPTLTRRGWFQAVSKLVMAKGSLRDAIEKQWGEIIKVVPTEKGTAEFLQAPPYGAFLLHRLNLRFVSAENSFYRYFPEGVGNENEGTWEYLTVTEVQREIMEWVVKKELNRVRLDLKEIGEAIRRHAVFLHFRFISGKPGFEIGQNGHAAGADFPNRIGNPDAFLRLGHHDPPQARDFLRADAGERFDFQRSPQGFVIHRRQNPPHFIGRINVVGFQQFQGLLFRGDFFAGVTVFRGRIGGVREAVWQESFFAGEIKKSADGLAVVVLVPAFPSQR